MQHVFLHVNFVLKMSDEWSEDYNDNQPQDGPTWFIPTQQLEEFRERFFALSHGKPHLTPEFVKETFDSILPGTDLFEIWYLYFLKSLIFKKKKFFIDFSIFAIVPFYLFYAFYV